ncbi:GntR family transcriptional regulator [Alicyclobacillus dauci]|uniref:GntR family transcriptional regulator n=1 Tax=Alicyclobacillus dauci TaxID=1475485 RepID=A0ABY6YXB2_9BACL|nr:GntR family transcriptional regulator [Alicyclobacillus dauci]WAH35235.1 GntR family transcriptional regulator [Alicyclobacillus dauci]
MDHIGKVYRTRLGHEIAKQLKKSILLGEMPSGQHLSEPLLAEQFGTSRGPVRDALQIVIREGFAQRELNGRVVVSGLSPPDISDLFDTRLLLEVHAIRKISRTGTKQDILQSMRDTLDQAASQTISESEFCDLDMTFHELILHLAGSRFLSQSWQGIRGIIRSISEVTNRDNPTSSIHEEHRQILCAICDEQFVTAESVLTTHIKLGETAMIARLTALRNRSIAAPSFNDLTN